MKLTAIFNPDAANSYERRIDGQKIIKVEIFDNRSSEEIKDLIKQVIFSKPDEHGFSELEGSDVFDFTESNFANGTLIKFKGRAWWLNPFQAKIHTSKMKYENSGERLRLRY